MGDSLSHLDDLLLKLRRERKEQAKRKHPSEDWADMRLVCALHSFLSLAEISD